jgi:hypothetical protein
MVGTRWLAIGILRFPMSVEIWRVTHRHGERFHENRYTSLNDAMYHYMNGEMILGGEIMVPANGFCQSKVRTTKATFDKTLYWHG